MGDGLKRAFAATKATRQKPSFNDIPRFPDYHYSVDISWAYLEEKIGTENQSTLDLSPDFQRGHVWTDEQASAYVEYQLRGGRSGRDLYFNCPGYTGRSNMVGPYVIVDGLQRLTAVRRFLRGEIRAFGRLVMEYRDRPDRFVYAFKWNVAELETRAEVLKWYIDFNAGGTPHSAEEIARVRKLLDAEASK